MTLRQERLYQEVSRVAERVETYGLGQDAYAGLRLDLDRAIIHVYFSERLGGHMKALETLEAHGIAIHGHRVKWSLHTLHRIQRLIGDHLQDQDLMAQGVRISSVGIDIGENCVRVTVGNLNEEVAARFREKFERQFDLRIVKFGPAVRPVEAPGYQGKGDSGDKLRTRRQIPGIPQRRS